MVIGIKKTNGRDLLWDGTVLYVKNYLVVSKEKKSMFALTVGLWIIVLSVVILPERLLQEEYVIVAGRTGMR